MIHRTERRAPIVIGGLAVLLVLVACRPGTPSPDPAPTGVLSVSQAAGLTRDPASVHGYVLAGRDGSVRFCEGLSGSYPPQCGSPSLALRSLDLSRLPGVETESGVSWTGEITLTGALADGVLTVG